MKSFLPLLAIVLISLFLSCDNPSPELNKVNLPDSLTIKQDTNYFLRYPAAFQLVWLNDSALFRGIQLGSPIRNISESSATLLEKTNDSITFSVDIDGVESSDFTYRINASGTIEAISIYMYCKNLEQRNLYIAAIQDFYIRKTGASWSNKKLISPAAGIEVQYEELGNSKVFDVFIQIKKSPPTI
ncbi:MAG: hypothetical protein MUE33_09915 [Cytophagaceae bacterium]|jgi:hypothetical protein|nr:hypothetical protein [Cytophagaceae bacterium]